MSTPIKKDKEIIASSLTISLQWEDPVEEHICKELIKLKIQNERYKAHIEKTASWIHIKDINGWKSFDFYNYFCYNLDKLKTNSGISGTPQACKHIPCQDDCNSRMDRDSCWLPT